MLFFIVVVVMNSLQKKKKIRLVCYNTKLASPLTIACTLMLAKVLRVMKVRKMRLELVLKLGVINRLTLRVMPRLKLGHMH